MRASKASLVLNSWPFDCFFCKSKRIVFRRCCSAIPRNAVRENRTSRSQSRRRNSAVCPNQDCERPSTTCSGIGTRLPQRIRPIQVSPRGHLFDAAVAKLRRSRTRRGRKLSASLVHLSWPAGACRRLCPTVPRCHTSRVCSCDASASRHLRTILRKTRTWCWQGLPGKPYGDANLRI